MDLPSQQEGLNWIDDWIEEARSHQAPHELLLIPGVRAADITSAAVGNLQALGCLRAAAEQHAAEIQGQGRDLEVELQTAVGRHGAWWEAMQECQHNVPDTVKVRELCRRGPATCNCLFDAAFEGELAAVKWLLALCFYDVTIWHHAAAYATEEGHLAILQYMAHHEPSVVFHQPVISEAPRHLDCTQWLLAQGVEFDEFESMGTAAKAGNQAVIAHLRAMDPPFAWDEQCTYWAAATGNLQLLQHLRSYSPPCPINREAVTVAIRHNRPDVLQWLVLQDPVCPRMSSREKSVQYDYDPVMRTWTWQSRHPQDVEYTNTAARHGNLTMLAWLYHSQGCRLDDSAYHEAIQHGHHHIVTWLHAQAVPFPNDPPARLSCWNEAPSLMLYADMGVRLNTAQHALLQRARQTFCAFHGLLRWCQRVLASSLACNVQGPIGGIQPNSHLLLVELCRLPQVLIDKIATMAQLQHDVVF